MALSSQLPHRCRGGNEPERQSQGTCAGDRQASACPTGTQLDHAEVVKPAMVVTVSYPGAAKRIELVSVEGDIDRTRWCSYPSKGEQLAVSVVTVAFVEGPDREPLVWLPMLVA